MPDNSHYSTLPSSFVLKGFRFQAAVKISPLQPALQLQPLSRHRQRNVIYMSGSVLLISQLAAIFQDNFFRRISCYVFECDISFVILRLLERYPDEIRGFFPPPWNELQEQ